MEDDLARAMVDFAKRVSAGEATPEELAFMTKVADAFPRVSCTNESAKSFVDAIKNIKR